MRIEMTFKIKDGPNQFFKSFAQRISGREPIRCQCYMLIDRGFGMLPTSGVVGSTF